MATTNEGTTDNRHGEISLADNQHTDEFLVAIDDKVASQLLRLFFVLNKLLGSCLLQVASIGLDFDAISVQEADRHLLFQPLTLSMMGTCPSSLIDSIQSPLLT